MVWQFGELGYHFSINTCSDTTTISSDCRTSAKPIKWNYIGVPERLAVYNSYMNMAYLKNNYEALRLGIFTSDLSGLAKKEWITHSSLNLAISGNFTTSTLDMQPNFQHTGTWYDYYTGQSFEVTDVNQTESYEAGEFHVYMDQNIQHPVTVEDNVVKTNDILLYPNPANEILYILADDKYNVNVYDITGKSILSTIVNQGENYINTSNLKNGIYLINFVSGTNKMYKKIVINK